MSPREERLFYTGDGTYYLPGIPARDLDAADIAALSDRSYADAVTANPATGKPLYQKTRPAGREREARPERPAPGPVSDPVPDAAPDPASAATE